MRRMAHRMHVKWLFKPWLKLCILVLAAYFLIGYLAIDWPTSAPRFTASLRSDDNSPKAPIDRDLVQNPRLQQTEINVSSTTEEASSSHRNRLEIVLVVVACGERLNDTLVVLKSALLFTKSPLRFLIIADDDLRPRFKAQISSWPKKVRDRFKYTLLPLRFPDDGLTEEWKKLFKPCASQRLFLPSVLNQEDAVLYVDADVIFLTPLDKVWSFFQEMNSSQLAAMTPEHEDYAIGWYNRFAQHPYYHPLGVNSGVMLMNLTRMRHFEWEKYLAPIYKKYKLKITWGDQDILNVLFHDHPDKLFVYPCEWNFRPDHCMYSSVCNTAEDEGVAIVHGSRGVFHNDKQPAFRALYEAVLEYRFEEDYSEYFLKPLKARLKETVHTNCGKVHNLFLKPLAKRGTVT